MPLVAAECEAGMDSARAAARKIVTCGLLCRRNEQQGVEPEVPVELSISLHKLTSQCIETIAQLRLDEDRVAQGQQRSEEVITCCDALAQQTLRDRVGLVHMMDVAYDAEQVPSISAFVLLTTT
jgi:hypothetical protein